MIYIAYVILGSLAIIIALFFLFFLCRHNFCLAKTLFECISCYFDLLVAHEITEHLDVKSENYVHDHEMKYTEAGNKESCNINKNLQPDSILLAKPLLQENKNTLESHPEGKSKINFENSSVQYKSGFPTAIISSPLPSERHNSM